MSQTLDPATSESLVYKLLDNQPDPVIYYEPVINAGSVVDFKIIYANPKAFGAFNLVPGDLLLRNGSLLQEFIFAELKQVLSFGYSAEKPFHDEISNSYITLFFSKVNDGVMVVVRDVTAITRNRLLNEEKIEQTNQKLQIIFDHSRAGMYTLKAIRNDNGEIEEFRFGLVNQAVASYLGMKAEDIAGSLGSTYFPAYKTNGLFDRYVESMTTGNPATFDLHYEDGYDNFFTIHVVPIGDELFGTFTENTSLKRLQRELESSIAELKRSNASLEQFAHAASHDLQEPLRRITKLADDLEKEYGYQLNDNAFEYIEKIKTAARRMQILIRDLLVFAQVGSVDKEKTEVDLDSLLQEVLQNLEVAIAERDAEITVNPIGKIMGNSLHLQQMFQNLLSNSLKYSSFERKPAISIESSLIQGKDTGFELGEFEIKQQYLQVILRDNGQGFCNEDATRIFKIFQRLPQHRNEYQGTGIGLAIVQRVVQSHKGYIKAEGIPGEGATFTIILPVG